MPARRRADETVRDRLIVLRRMMRPLVFHSTPRNRLRHAEPGARFLGLSAVLGRSPSAGWAKTAGAAP